MLSRYFQRGIAAGGVTGLLYGVYLQLVVEPQIRYLEGLAGEHAHESHGLMAEATATLYTVGGGVLWGVLLGACFAVTYYLLEPELHHRLGSYVVAAAGLVTVSLAPWAALPPVPPGVTRTMPAETRVVLYAVLMAVGAAVCATCLVLNSRISRRRNRAVRYAVSMSPLLLLVAAALLSPAGYSSGPPEPLRSSFVWTVAFGQTALWFGLALTFDRLEPWFEPAYAVEDLSQPSTATE